MLSDRGYFKSKRGVGWGLRVRYPGGYCQSKPDPIWFHATSIHDYVEFDIPTILQRRERTKTGTIRVLLTRLPDFTLTACLNKCAQDVIHKGLVAFAARSEPFQYIVVDANIDMVFSGLRRNS
jgi:hypothetical protein